MPPYDLHRFIGASIDSDKETLRKAPQVMRKFVWQPICSSLNRLRQVPVWQKSFLCAHEHRLGRLRLQCPHRGIYNFNLQILRQNSPSRND